MKSRVSLSSVDGIDRITPMAAIVILAIAIISLWLRAAYLPMGLWGAYDDALFVAMADSIKAGKWLGTYDHLVLAKGAMFPIFMAANSLTGLPLKVSEHVLYLMAALFAATTSARLTRQAWLLIPAFAILALTPTAWMVEGGARVTREPLYMVLTLTLLFAAVRYSTASARGYGLAIALGVVGGCFWLTREEGIWLLPALAVMFLPLVVKGVRNLRGGCSGYWRRAAIAVCVPVTAFLSVVMSVNLINLAVYGVFRNNELRSGPFVRAYGALSRISNGEWRRYVIFPNEARQRAYVVSPAVKELMPYFEGPGAARWVQASHDYPKPWGCREESQACNKEILSGWFVWALRDAAKTAGYYGSAAEADAYFSRIADEVNAGCEHQVIPCREPRNTLAPVWRGHYMRDTLVASREILSTLIHLNGGQIGVPASVLTSEQAAIFRSAIHGGLRGIDDMDEPTVGWQHDVREMRLALMRGIATFYAIASPWLFGLALASYCFILLAAGRIKSARVSGNAVVIMTALLAAILSRVAVLGFLDATSIPSNNLLYLLPAVPIYLLFIVLSIAIAIAAIWNVVHRKGVPSA